MLMFYRFNVAETPPAGPPLLGASFRVIPLHFSDVINKKKTEEAHVTVT